MDKKAHWENIFQTKDTTIVSWYQAVPATSINLIQKTGLSANSAIIEIGSGDSFLVDHLIEKGYTDISLLDISENALETIRKRLGEKSNSVTFVATDINNFSTDKRFNIWHDRAVFHFLTEKKDIENYVKIATKSVIRKGFLIIGTFSDKGPDSCSGLTIEKYSESKLTAAFSAGFSKLECFTENHNTPSGGIQNFLFCIFQRK